MNRFLIPLAAFTALVVFLGIGLTLNPRTVPSPLIDKAAPAFALPQLHDPNQSLTRSELLGQVWLLNVWASWCLACRDEHAVLLSLARSGSVPIYGLNYKDKRDDALSWLQRFSDPYTLSASDADGRVGIDFGVYGVPETFVIDRRGIIRFKHIGPLTTAIVNDRILPLVRELQKS